jgi:opacity protein-like surface antigen
MKKASLLLLLSTLFLINSVQAETVQQYGNRGQDGVIFAVRGSWDIGVGTIEAGIGYKHWISERLAIKSFLTFGKTDTTIVYYDDGYPPEQRVKEKSFSLLAGVEDHIWKQGKLSFFYGGGIQFKTSSSQIDNTLYDPVPQEIKGIRSSKNVFGIQSTLGVEYFLTKRLSLSGQYQTDFSLGKESRKNILVGGPGVPQSTKQKITTWNLGLSTSALILTIYL